MKNLAKLMFSILFLISSGALAQVESQDRLLGTWLMENRESKIQIFKKGNQFNGKLVWSKDMYEVDGKTSRKDVNNKNGALRSRELKDLPLLSGFAYDDGEWKDGKIYDIKSGKDYSCLIKMNGPDIMLVRGYVGFSMLGKTVSFSRVKN
jgi:uncharacterized protein (DUF2147 family)